MMGALCDSWGKEGVGQHNAESRSGLANGGWCNGAPELAHAYQARTHCGQHCACGCCRGCCWAYKVGNQPSLLWPSLLWPSLLWPSLLVLLDPPPPSVPSWP